MDYRKAEPIRCPKCRETRHKIVRTHGMKSHGYKVCKNCGEIIR